MLSLSNRSVGRRLVTVLVSVLLLSACQDLFVRAGAERRGQGSAPTEEKENIEGLFGYFRRIESLSTQQRAAEYLRVRHRFGESDTDKVSLFRLIFLLSIPDTPHQDYEKALSLVDGYLARPDQRDRAFMDLAYYMRTELLHHARRERKLRALEGTVKASTNLQKRLQYEREQTRAALRQQKVLEDKLNTAQAEVEKLRQQIDALDSIEDAIETRKTTERIELPEQND